MKNPGEITIEGVVVEVRDGSKKIRRNYTYGYRSLRVQVEFDYYSVLVNTSKLNEFGFIPKVGQWIRVTGRLSQSKDDFYDPSISWISQLQHIDPPRKKVNITSEMVLDILTNQWQNLSQISTNLNIKSDLEKNLLNKILKELLKESKISEISKREKLFWKRN
jgi:hypothetical protein